MYFNDEKSNTNIDQEFSNRKSFKLPINFSKKNFIIIGGILLVVVIIMAFTLIKPRTEYFLTLNGSASQTIYQDMEYIDAGYNAYDNKGNEYYEDVIVSGDVNTSIAGDYTIIYTFGDLEQIRNISVIPKTQQITF